MEIKIVSFEKQFSAVSNRRNVVRDTQTWIDFAQDLTRMQDVNVAVGWAVPGITRRGTNRSELATDR